MAVVTGCHGLGCQAHVIVILLLSVLILYPLNKNAKLSKSKETQQHRSMNRLITGLPIGLSLCLSIGEHTCLSLGKVLGGSSIQGGLFLIDGRIILCYVISFYNNHFIFKKIHSVDAEKVKLSASDQTSSELQLNLEETEKLRSGTKKKNKKLVISTD